MTDGTPLPHGRGSVGPMSGGHPLSFSVVVPTHNRAAWLQRCLAHLLFQTYPHYEVIVVDDGSEDGTPALLRLHFRQVLCLSEPHRGPAAARNRGIAAARGDVVAFTADDCLVPPDWLARLAEGLRNAPEAAGVGGYRVPAAGLTESSAFSRYEQWRLAQSYQSLRDARVGGSETPAGAAHNVAYRRAVLDEAGGFDERFPYPAGEDEELKHRLCDGGHRLLYLPIPVAHLDPGDRTHFRQRAYRRGRGGAFYQHKRGARVDRASVTLSRVHDALDVARGLVGAQRWAARLRLVEVYESWRGAMAELASQEAPGPHPNPLPEGEGIRGSHPSSGPQGEGTLREGRGTARP